jgi:predicted nucleic acid-binding protein
VSKSCESFAAFLIARRFGQLFPGLTTFVSNLFRRLDKRAVMINEVPRVFEYLRDPNDEPYINLAIAARAKYLVSRDKDLLDLMAATDLESKQFRQRFRFLRIIDPAALLHDIKRLGAERA